MKFNNKNVFIILALGFILIVGYYKSDDKFYNRLIQTHNLTSPAIVFNWVHNYYGVPKVHFVEQYVSPRYLIEKRENLYCDEAAIIMATLDHSLGFKTRLIDLYGSDNISHHTILQVCEKKKWINYDFTYNIIGGTLDESASSHGFKLKEGKIKQYPKIYNWIINNNFFLKKLIFKLRAIKE